MIGFQIQAENWICGDCQAPSVDPSPAEALALPESRRVITSAR